MVRTGFKLVASRVTPAFVVIWNLLWPAHATAQNQPWATDAMASMHQTRQLGLAVARYAFDHHGQMPPDLGAILKQLDDQAGADGAVSATSVQKFLVAPGQRTPETPANVGAEWLAGSSSYVYLGRDGVSFDDLPPWGETVVAHLKLDRGLPGEATADNPEGLLYAVVFADGRSEVVPRAVAERLIAESETIYRAAVSGEPYPDHLQPLVDLALLAKAVRAYSKDHEGLLPPDLGATFPYIEKDTKRTSTPAKRAAAYLSPHVRATTHIPGEPTPEWINAHASYVYLGAPGVPLAKVEDPQRTVLIHAKPVDTVEVVPRRGPVAKSLPLVTFGAGAENMPLEAAEWWIAESKKVIASAKDGGPLPDYQHAVRDIRLISAAITAYVAAHEGRLPPNLGATLAFLPAESGHTQAERARVYMSPRRERISPAPEDAGAEWITGHASYPYLGAELVRKELQEKGDVLLVYTPPDEAFPIYTGAAQSLVAPAAGVFGHVFAPPADWVRDEAARAKAAIAELRGVR